MPTCTVSRTTLSFPATCLHSSCFVPTVLNFVRFRQWLGSEKVVDDWGRSRTWPEYWERGMAMKKKTRRLVPGVFVCLSVVTGCLIGPPAQYVFAQTEKASISGRITDQSNAMVLDAEVEIRNTDTGIVASSKTNDQGVYAFPSLAPGNYVMSVNKQGFRTVSVTDIKLYVQDNVSRNFVMQVGSSAESITVVAQSEAGLG